MQRGYYTILERLFAPGAMYRRSSALIEHLEPHIFRGGTTRGTDVRAAARSLWRQGITGRARREYFRLLWTGVSRDVARSRAATRSAAEMERRLMAVREDPSIAGGDDMSALSTLVQHAHEARVRAERRRPLADVDAWAASLRANIERRMMAPTDLQVLYEWSREYIVRKRRLHRFPGAYLVKAFNLAIKGLHYTTVMNGLTRESSVRRAAADGAVRLAERA